LLFCKKNLQSALRKLSAKGIFYLQNAFLDNLKSLLMLGVVADPVADAKYRL
jgi:hypothetical protein